MLFPKFNLKKTSFRSFKNLLTTNNFHMKKLTKHVSYCATILSLFSSPALAKVADNFYLKPFATIEYSAPVITNGGSNSEFKTHNFGQQLRHFDNIAIGGSLRVHKNLGFNLNWAKTELKNDTLQNIGALSQEARFKMNQINLTALGYAPLSEAFEAFAELGVADINSRLHYATAVGAGANRKAHETKMVYGLGLQFKPCPMSDDAIRLSFQKYAGRMGLLNAQLTTVRIGYMKAF